MATEDKPTPIYSKLPTKDANSVDIELSLLRDKLTDSNSNSEITASQRMSHGMRSTDILTLRNELLQAARDGVDEKFNELLQFISSSKLIQWKPPGGTLSRLKTFTNITELLNSYDDNRHTLLHYTARYNRHSILNTLVNNVSYKINFVARTDMGYTPLHYAARYISVEQENLDFEVTTVEDLKLFSENPKLCSVLSLRLLMESQRNNPFFNINDVDTFGQTALHHACIRGNYFAVKELIAGGIYVDSTDLESSTALHIACERGYVNIVSLLIEQTTTHILSYNMHGSTPFHLAAVLGSEKIFKILCTKLTDDNIDLLNLLRVCVDSKGNTILHSACLGGNKNLVAKCIELGISLESENNDGAKPIHLSAQQGFVPSAVLLLETDKLGLGTIDKLHNTPLHYAARNSRHGMIAFLLEKGAIINTKNLNSNTPLMLAAYYGSSKSVKEILKHFNCQVELRDSWGKNALLIAIEKNERLVVTEILNHKRGRWLVNEKDDEDKTPLHVVAKHGYVDILDLLLNTNNCDVIALNSCKETPLHVAAYNGNVTIVQRLLDYLDELSIELLRDEDKYGNTALHVACEHGQLDVVELLIKFKSNVNALNFQIKSPLHLAAIHGHIQVAEYLLQEEAPVDGDKKSRVSTPLLLACQAGHTQMVSLLLKHGADICKHEDGAEVGNNSLDLAIDAGNEEVVETLLSHRDIRRALKNYTCVYGRVFTPLRKMIPKMPIQAYKVMSQCMSSNFASFDSPDNRKVRVNFEFELLDDVESFQTFFLECEEKYREMKKPILSNLYEKSRLSKKSHPLDIMVQNSRLDLLSHPLVLTLMRLKWSTRASYLYYINLITYVIFLLLLTLFTFVVPSCDLDINHIFKTNTCDIDPRATSWYVDTYGCSRDNCNTRRVISSMAMAGIIIVLAVFRLFFESVQIIGNIKGYFLGIENYIEWFIYVGSIVFVSDVFKNRHLPGDCGFSSSILWELGSFVVLLAWFNFVIFLGKLPHLGIYILMFLHVITTFFRVFLLALAFLVGFSVSFYMVFRQQNTCSQFRHPFSSLLKTSVMLTGEFEYDNIFNDFAQRLDHPISSYILFLVFIVIVSIILANLLVGLAVDDIKGVQESAHLKRLSLKIDLLLTFEETFPFSIFNLRKRSALKAAKVYPNRSSLWSKVLLAISLKAVVKMKDVLKALDTKKYHPDNSSNWQQKLENDNTQIRRSLRKLELREEKLQLREQRLEIREQNIEKMLIQLTKKLIPEEEILDD